jgi:hypothetical protein
VCICVCMCGEHGDWVRVCVYVCVQANHVYACECVCDEHGDWVRV